MEAKHNAWDLRVNGEWVDVRAMSDEWLRERLDEKLRSDENDWEKLLLHREFWRRKKAKGEEAPWDG